MANERETEVDDRYRGRAPSTHERAAGHPWDVSYRGGPPPWDIGAPQPAVARLVAAGAFYGAVLDAGCGTGDNALCIAARGHPVVGFDVAPTAVSIARAKAAAQGVKAEFVVADALGLDGLNRLFDTVLDCALFHALDHGERRRYIAGLAPLTRVGGVLRLVCFADSSSEETGPHPVGQQQLRDAFTNDPHWNITSIDSEQLYARFAPEGLPAWLATVKRVGA
jgi:SAM-dependent methyltransferase